MIFFNITYILSFMYYNLLKIPGIRDSSHFWEIFEHAVPAQITFFIFFLCVLVENMPSFIHMTRSKKSNWKKN